MDSSAISKRTYASHRRGIAVRTVSVGGMRFDIHEGTMGTMSLSESCRRGILGKPVGHEGLPQTPAPGYRAKSRRKERCMNRCWGLRGISIGLAVIAAAPGCKDNSDDPADLFVVTVVPGDQQTNTPTSSAITLRFSTNVDLATTGSNQVILVDQNNSIQPISIAVGASAEYLVVTPVTPLQPNLTYGVAVREGVKADTGEPIEAPFSMTFSTGATLSTIPGFPPFLTGSLIPPNTGAAGTFTLTGQLVTARARHTATLLQSGNVLVVGGASPRRVSASGTTLRSAEVYSPSSGTWRNTRGNGQALQMFYARYGHTATPLSDGRVLVAGGWDERVVSDTAELYDPVTDSFAPTTGRIPRTITFHTATKVANGNVILTGGFSDTGTGAVSRDIYVYDAPTGTFMLGQNSMRIARCYHASVLLGDGQTVLITGGIIPWPFFILGPWVTTMCDTFKPDLVSGPGTQGPVNPSGAMDTARMNHTLTLVTTGVAAGMVLCVGGNTGYVSTEIYDPNITISGGFKGDWALVAANMTRSRRAHTSNLIEKGADAGKLVVIGGAPTGITPDLYWAPHWWPSTESHNCGQCATTITAELFDPFGYGQQLSSAWKGIDVTGRFGVTTDAQGNQTMMVGVPPNPVGNGGRYYHTATTLVSGHVLVVGGWDCPYCGPVPTTASGPETALGTTELYNP